VKEHATCNTTGKIRYRNEREANTAVANALAKDDAPVALRVYRCVYCGSYHLTKQMK